MQNGKPVIAVMLTDKESKDFILPDGYVAHHSLPSRWEGFISHREDMIYAPSFPHIEAAYEKEGKKIFRPNAEEQTSNDSVQTPDTTSSNTDDTSIPMESPSDNDVQEEAPVSYEDFEVEDSKVDWRSLSWLPLRTFAKQFTDEKIKNKEHAWEILEALEAEGRL